MRKGLKPFLTDVIGFFLFWVACYILIKVSAWWWGCSVEEMKHDATFAWSVFCLYWIIFKLRK